ncbi:adenylate/guanylate cyclase domain-containing protein [Mycolicibacterium lacusdiani]|uniref:adenylate/guanylate cyclase domain-containing protein n=1 Tax=Mycolicibacterium lacusdiani TaxID=2895283 RepID=UPI001F42A06A|nr:adenylate/guanylate cyclase domain-containing protein [Mycolicibacterium lacusdiani]
MSTPSTLEVILFVVTALLSAGLVTFVSLFVAARRRLTAVRRELEAVRTEGSGRRRRRGVGPMAVKSVLKTADAVLNRGLGAVQNSIDQLAGWAQVERPDLARLTPGGDVVLVFSDIEGSTRLNAALGDKAWVKLLERHDDLVHTHVARHGGNVVKSQGDGFMIAFAEPRDAVLFGTDVQRALEANPQRWQDIRVRIGVHMGTSVRRGDDLFGLDVATAARVADQADGGEILVSAPVRDAVSDLADVHWGPPRDVELKGVPGVHTLHPVLAG